MSDAVGFTIVERRRAAEVGFIHVDRLQVKTPDGDTVERVMVDHPGAVAVLPIDDGEVVLVSQYRAPVDQHLLEVPAGKRDVADEPPIETARRELEEEVGMRASVIEPVTGFHTGPGFTNEFIHLFVATGLESVEAKPHGAEERHAQVVRVAVADVPDLIAAGSVTDVKTLVALQWLAMQP